MEHLVKPVTQNKSNAVTASEFILCAPHEQTLDALNTISQSPY